jgi:hypothetical protein
MSNAQTPVAAAAFDAPMTVAAWHDKPSYGIVATADRALNPMLARWMYERSGAKITEIKASHLGYISQPGRQRHRQGGLLHRTEYDEPLDDARAPHDYLDTTAYSLAKEMRIFEGG